MKSILFLCSIMLMLCMCSGSKNPQPKEELADNDPVKSINDSLTLLSDSILLGNTTEGEEVLLYRYKNNADSVLIVESMGEMGRAKTTYIFNNGLKSAEKITYTYQEPIYLNNDPKIASTEKEKYVASGSDNANLLASFYSYYRYFGKYHISPNKQWNGRYKVVLNEDDEDWRNDIDLQLIFKKDSIIYEAKGYQVFQKYLLTEINLKNNIHLFFWKALDGTGSAVLKKTEDFGDIKGDGNSLTWESPYVSENFNIPLKPALILNKEPL